MSKKLLFSLFFLFCTITSEATIRNGVWQLVSDGATLSQAAPQLKPERYAVYVLHTQKFKEQIAAISEEPITSSVIELPMPNGEYRSFKIWRSPVMEQGLADRYPEIKTFTGVALDDKYVTAKLDYTVFGFHAMVFDGINTYFIDPYSNIDDGYYLCYYKKDYKRDVAERMPCVVPDEDELHQQRLSLTDNGLPDMPLKVNGAIKRTYLLALAATAQYSAAVAGPSPTKPAVLSKMVTSMNRINGVYERELAITMQLVANNDDLIYLAEPDPYGTSSSGMLNQNQNNIDAVIGSANYDIGHVFSTVNGGIASLGCVCNLGTKAKGVTGQSNPTGDAFDIDYVAHEMGHQFGATHTFNANISAGSCSGNAASNSAYEPGGGTTIMAYAGICGATNNLQAHSDAYFHAKSLDQISNFISAAGTCASTTASGNTPSTLPPFASNYYIPFQTPFELTAPNAADINADELTYCWEQWNLGDFGQNFFNTKTFGPIFRSFKPVTSRTRVFPTMEKLLNNVTNYLGEKLPEDDRELTFRLTVRDIYNGIGCFNFPNDEINLHVINTGVPFKVNEPNTASNYWQIGSNVTVTWDVANTNTAPINCSSVDIMLSVDGGWTYPVVLTSGTPNDGSETITVPNAPTASARVKVKGGGNVFFDISNENFRINTWPADVAGIGNGANLEIFPNPASQVLYISPVSGKNYNGRIVNAIGQEVWNGKIASTQRIPVDGWSTGIYHVQLINTENNERTVKKVLVQ